MENKNVRIIDRTLIELWEKDKVKFIRNIDKIKKLSILLYEIGADIIEINSEIYELLKPAKKNNHYAINMEKKTVINDVSEIENKIIGNKRIYGLGNMILYEFKKINTKLIDYFGNDLELCFYNDYGCATALSTEWINSGGSKVITSFSGIGNITPLEEILSINKFLGNIKFRGNLVLFPKVLNLFQDIIEEDIPKNKPIIGDGIFDVESGVHVDGILKNPSCFEPFEPKLIGRSRSIVIGKFSGKKSIKIKLKELNIEYKENKIKDILNEVRNESTKKMRGLYDIELFEICKKVGV